MQKKQPTIEILTDKACRAIQKYSESPHTTNAGAVLRFIAMFLPVETLITMLAHKIAPQNT